MQELRPANEGPPRGTVGGIVLCGGRSSRMGQSKAWLPFGDERMLQRVVRILSGVVSPVVVVMAPGQDIPSLPPGVRIAHDSVEGRGPLEGLLAGLMALPDCAAAYATSCDVPLLRESFVKRLIELLGSHEIVVPVEAQFHHPLAAVYCGSVVGIAASLLAAGQFRPAFLFDRARTLRVAVSELRAVDADLTSLRNVNYWDDYVAALNCAGLPAPPRDVPRDG